jgi:hypothetical protein
MAKTKAAKRKSTSTWTGADHESRTAKRIASLQKKQRKQGEKSSSDHHHQQPTTSKRRLTSQLPSNTYKRTHLAHDNPEKLESSKLRLATSQLERQIDSLHSRLSNWDPSDLTNNDIINEGRVVSCNFKEVERKMELHAVNRKEDWEAREKARGEQILIEAERGVNSSVGRRKGELLYVFVVVLMHIWCI